MVFWWFVKIRMFIWIVFGSRLWKFWKFSDGFGWFVFWWKWLGNCSVFILMIWMR